MTDAELKARLQALIDTFVQEERAAVVAWLRRDIEPEYEALTLRWARDIESGEHRSEEGA